MRGVTLSRCLLLMEAAVQLMAAKTLLNILPFQRVAGRLGRTTASDRREISTVTDIARALRTIGRYIPPLRQCLLQSIAARWMLSRRGIANTIVLGVSKNSAERLLAHAWVRVGRRTVVGESGRAGYQIISSFGDACAEEEIDAG